MPTETPKPTEAPKQDETGTLPGDQVFSDSPVPDLDGNVIVNSIEDLQYALGNANDGTTIKVGTNLENVSISANLTGETVIIDLQGNTLTADANDVFNFTLSADSTISIMNGTIDGNGRDARGIVINGTAGGDVILAGLTIEGFSSTQEGTALNINGIKDVTISSNHFTGNVFGKSNVRINGYTVYDGKKYVPSGKTTISDSEFSGNTSVMEDSDTVWINGTDVELTNCRFENNTAGNVGGLYLGEAGTISNTTFSGNTGGVAGGLYIKKNVRGNAVYVKGSTFSENHAKFYTTKTDDLIAGAIVVDNRTFIDGTNVKNNTSNSGAGGICTGQNCEITNSVISENSVASDDIYASGGLKTTCLGLNFKSSSSSVSDNALYNNQPCDFVSTGAINGLLAASSMKLTGIDFTKYVWKNLLTNDGPEVYKEAISGKYDSSGNIIYNMLRIKAELSDESKGTLTIKQIVEGPAAAQKKEFHFLYKWPGKFIFG